MLKMKQKIVFILEALDIFSIPPSFLFTFKNKFQYSTFSTKCMTFIVTIFSVSSFFYFANDFINLANPQSLLIEEYDKNPGIVNFGPNDFFFAFALENSTNKYLPFIDETIYKVEAQLEIKNETGLYRKNLAVGGCDNTDFPIDQNLRNFSESHNFTSMYCLKNYSQIMMNGSWDSDVFKGVKIKLRPCNNTLDGITCKSSDIINQYLESKFFLMRYVTAQTNLDNYDTPISLSMSDDFRQVSFRLAMSVYLYFGRIKVQTDTGWFQESFVTQEAVSLTSSTFLPYVNTYDQNLFTVYLRLDAVSKVTKRKYDKILNILSNVGGMMRVLSVLGAFILKPFLKEAMLQRVSNETFDYRQIMEDLGEKDDGEHVKMKLSLWEYFKTKIKTRRKLSRRARILMHSIEQMKKKLDISSLINKLVDIEKLKLTISNNEFLILKEQKPKILFNDVKFKATKFKSEKEKFFHELYLLQSIKNSQRLAPGKIKPEIKKKSFTSPAQIPLQNFTSPAQLPQKSPFELVEGCVTLESPVDFEKGKEVIELKKFETKISDDSNDKNYKETKEIKLSKKPMILYLKK